MLTLIENKTLTFVCFDRLREKASSAEADAAEWQRKANAGESRCGVSQTLQNTPQLKASNHEARNKHIIGEGRDGGHT